MLPSPITRQAQFLNPFDTSATATACGPPKEWLTIPTPTRIRDSLAPSFPDEGSHWVEPRPFLRRPFGKAVSIPTEACPPFLPQAVCLVALDGILKRSPHRRHWEVRLRRRTYLPSPRSLGHQPKSRTRHLRRIGTCKVTATDIREKAASCRYPIV